jgi:hypothetical protein
VRDRNIVLDDILDPFRKPAKLFDSKWALEVSRYWSRSDVIPTLPLRPENPLNHQTVFEMTNRIARIQIIVGKQFEQFSRPHLRHLRDLRRYSLFSDRNLPNIE